MAFTNQTRRTSATGSGAIGQEVPFSFPISNTSDLVVRKRVTATGVPTTLTETTNYTITIAGVSGGTLTTVTAIGTDETIHLERNTPITQQLELESGGSYNAEDIETAFDKNTKLSSEATDDADRSIHIPATDTSITTELPSAIDRASKNLTFDSSGNISASVSVATGSVSFTTFGTNMAEAANDNAGKIVMNIDHVFDVTDSIYGATGDGVTNDLTAIELAEVACAAAGGGIVFFPAGTYIVEGADQGSFREGITITADNVIFMGVGRASIIKQDSNEAQFCFNDNGAADPVTNVRFTRLKFVGNTLDHAASGSSSPFRMQLFDNVEIDHCFFEGFSRATCMNGATGITTKSKNLWFHHNDVFGGDATVSTTGIKCNFAKNMWIHHNRFRKVARPLAIELNSTSSYTITDVWFHDNLIEDCTVSTASNTNTYRGCLVSGTDNSNVVNNIHITNNTFRNNTKGAGASGAGHEISIVGASGAETVTGVVVTGNTFIGFNSTSGNGIRIIDAHRNIVSNNILLNPAASADAAIRVRNTASENLIVNNIINGANWSLALREDQAAASAVNNVFWGNHDTDLGVNFANIADTQSVYFARGAAQTMALRIGSFRSDAFLSNSGIQLGSSSREVMNSFTFITKNGNIVTKNGEILTKT